MKPEEAIRVIEVAKAECEWSAPLDYQVAFDMAIEALKAQPNLQPTCNNLATDAISRQAAIDALWAERMKHSEEMERNLETCSFALRADNKARRNRVEEDIEIIKQLPPAQPEPTLKQIEEYCHERCLSIVDNALLHKYAQAEIQPEQKLGVWLIRRFGADAQCSECKMFFSNVYDIENSDAYCRHCGAKMEGLKVITDE